MGETTIRQLINGALINFGIAMLKRLAELPSCCEVLGAEGLSERESIDKQGHGYYRFRGYEWVQWRNRLVPGPVGPPWRNRGPPGYFTNLNQTNCWKNVWSAGSSGAAQPGLSTVYSPANIAGTGQVRLIPKGQQGYSVQYVSGCSTTVRMYAIHSGAC